MCARRFGILSGLDVRYDDIVRRVDVIAIEARGMVDVFVENLELTDRRILAFTTRGELRDPHELSAFVEIGALFAETDLNGWLARHAIAIPIRNGISRRARRHGRVPVDAAEIL